MKELTYSIADEVFELFPGYVRGVVLAYDVENGKTPPALIEMMRDAEASVRDRVALEEVAAHPRIASWREAYRAFGAPPSKFRSSIEAMVRRALRNQELPAINTLVDIGNVLSLRFLVPTGGHAIDEVTQDISLRPATGDEEFVAFGSDEIEHPKPGEIIFAEGNTVLTRRWTWRQANHTLTLPATKSIEFNVDGLPPTPVAEVEEVCAEVERLVGQFCGGRTQSQILTRENPQMQFSPR